MSAIVWRALVCGGRFHSWEVQGTSTLTFSVVCHLLLEKRVILQSVVVYKVKLFISTYFRLERGCTRHLEGGAFTCGRVRTKSLLYSAVCCWKRGHTSPLSVFIAILQSAIGIFSVLDIKRGPLQQYKELHTFMTIYRLEIGV